jgi:hypothetical protein
MKALIEIAGDILQRFDVPGDRRVALVTRLANVIDLAQDGGVFQRSPGGKRVDRQLTSLASALTRVRDSIEGLDPVTFRGVNRQLWEGDIPLLDEKSGASRTAAPQRIAEVLYALAGAMLKHVESLPREKAVPGPSGDLARFLAAELSIVYYHATGAKPTKRTDWGSGCTYGPFHEFVTDVLEQAGIYSPGADHVVKLAGDAPLNG